MAEEKKKVVTPGQAIGEIITVVVIMVIIAFILGRITAFFGEVTERVNIALGHLSVGETPIGDEIQTGRSTTVFDNEGNPIGEQPAGVSGTVTGGPIFRDGERHWYVDFAPPGPGGLDGWVPESALRGKNGGLFNPGDTPVGRRVETKEDIEVLREPGGTPVSTKGRGASGVVAAGPKAKDGVRYWYVDFDPPGEGGGDGWVREEALLLEGGLPFVPGGTPVGKEVKARSDLDVFDAPGGKSIGSHDKDDIGVVTDGPLYADGERYWYVDFDEGPDGWVKESELSPVPVFDGGDTPIGTVAEIAPGGARVFDAPGGSVIAQKNAGEEGVVAGGPIYKDGVRYWYVDFPTGRDGWIQEDDLRKEGGGIFDPGSTPVGSSVVAGNNLVVLDAPGGSIIGGQASAAVGTVAKGPEVKDGVRYWYIDFEDGPDGWVAEGNLRNPDGSFFTPRGTPVGSMIKLKRDADIENDGGDVIGRGRAGREGVIEQGPVYRNGERYWYVNFDRGPDGWVAESDLLLYEQPSLIRRIVSFFVSLARIMLWVLAVILVIAIAIYVMRTNAVATELHASVTPKKTEDVLEPAKNPAWERVVELSESENPSDWKLAIIEADTMLDRMLRGMGYSGDTTGDRLKAIERSDFTTLDDAWEAHKVRNRIAHEGGDFLITGRETRRIIQLYRRVFEEFRLI